MNDTREKLAELFDLADRVDAQVTRQNEANAKEMAEASKLLASAVEMSLKGLQHIAADIVVEDRRNGIVVEPEDVKRTLYKESGFRVLGKGPEQRLKGLKYIYEGQDLFITKSGKFLLLTYDGLEQGMKSEWSTSFSILTAEQVVKKFKPKAVPQIVDALLAELRKVAYGKRERNTVKMDSTTMVLEALATLLAQALSKKGK